MAGPRWLGNGRPRHPLDPSGRVARLGELSQPSDRVRAWGRDGSRRAGARRAAPLAGTRHPRCEREAGVVEAATPVGRVQRPRAIGRGPRVTARLGPRSCAASSPTTPTATTPSTIRRSPTGTTTRWCGSSRRSRGWAPGVRLSRPASQLRPANQPGPAHPLGPGDLGRARSVRGVIAGGEIGADREFRRPSSSRWPRRAPPTRSMLGSFAMDACELRCSGVDVDGSSQAHGTVRGVRAGARDAPFPARRLSG